MLVSVFREVKKVCAWVLMSFGAPVIPAKAGIHSANPWKRAVPKLDSRFRGNDRRLEWIPIPNDTSICACLAPDILINKGMGGEIDS
jgi:hypothetical protein